MFLQGLVFGQVSFVPESLEIQTNTLDLCDDIQWNHVQHRLCSPNLNKRVIEKGLKIIFIHQW